MTPDRTVVDTNVLIAAALRPRSTPRAAVDALVGANARLLFSSETLEEMLRSMFREKFDRYITRADRAQFLAQILDVFQFVWISGARMGCRDPEDDKILETALMGDAECIGTGDRDLLVMSAFRGIPIVTPREFLDV